MDDTLVRVAVRIRPLLRNEILYSQQTCVRVVPGNQQILLGKDRAFTFDHVFGSKVAQEEVYKTCIQPLVKSFVDGYNVTVFAYGQTGSGKTFTIGGANIASSIEDERGIIPRAIADLFFAMKESHNTDFSVGVSYIEVYKEELRDLLDIETLSKDMHIREDDKGNTVIIGTKESVVETEDEVLSLLEAGNAARHTGTTQMNEHSSRSHTIFTLTVTQRRPYGSSNSGDNLNNESESLSSKFHFVDLAGSERVSKTGNTGERFKESIQINSGLLALGNVISALGDPKRKSSHIPYRDAKITRILKDSLGGNAKTLMIACISPSSGNFDETINSLKYANRAKNIRNKPVVNYNPDWDRIDEMEQEIKTLREALHNQRSTLVTRASHVSQDFQAQDRLRMKSLEDQVGSLQTECNHYRNCTDEAYRFLMELRRASNITRNQAQRAKEWLDLAEEYRDDIATASEKDSGVQSTGEDPHHVTILQLKRELKKCQDGLAADENVFGLKEKELQELHEKVMALEAENKECLAALEDAMERYKQQSDKVVEQQMVIADFENKLHLLKSQHAGINPDIVPVSPVLSEPFRRPHTVPLKAVRPIHLSAEQASQSLFTQKARKVHTSPPTYSLERVVASFHARSQLLLKQLEEQDEVLRESFSDDGDEMDKPELRSHFRRSVNRTWSRKPTSFMSINKQSRGFVSKMAEQSVSVAGNDDEEALLQKSQIVNKRRLKDSEIRFMQAQQKNRELAINIRMKEELIRELVKTGKMAQAMNREYSEKMREAERETTAARAELQESQRQLQEVGQKEMRDVAEKARLQKEFRKRMEAAKVNIQKLHKKHQDTEKLASIATQGDKRQKDLERQVELMKQQQASFQKKLQAETEQKRQLENEMQRELQRIKDLEKKNEQQQKVLKVKSLEMAALQKQKQSGTFMSIEDEQKLEEQKACLDEEMERVLEQRHALLELQQELSRREDILAKKEALFQERSQLEIKRLRSSQVLNNDLTRLSSRLDMVDREISDRSKKLGTTSDAEQRRAAEELAVLQQEKQQLHERRIELESKLKAGNVLGTEERTLFRLDEEIDALEAAIAYKDEFISNQQRALRASTSALTQSQANMMGRLSCLSNSEIRTLLCRYFDKVVSLREAERRLNVQCAEAEMRADEQERIVRELELALDRVAMDMDRKLTVLQQEYEQKVQLLLQQHAGRDGVHDMKTHDEKIQQLEKDLFFYKMTSRELKKKLKESNGESVQHKHSQSTQQECIIIKVRYFSMLREHLSNGYNSLESVKTTGRKVSADSENSSFSRAERVSRLREEIAELVRHPTPPTTRRHSESSEDPPVTTELHEQPLRLPHVSDNTGRVVTVRKSRKELRQIPASEVTARRASLTSSVSSMPVDSIDAGKNP
uniref:Kinesin family member 27 n=1 Tax=Petromyzon marinus TaxID=7757 RepID=S4RAI3_PETMA